MFCVNVIINVIIIVVVVVVVVVVVILQAVLSKTPELRLASVQFSSVQFSSVQDAIYALRKAHIRYTPSLGSFLNVFFETVPMLVGLTKALSRPLKEGRRVVPLSTPLSSRRSMV